MYYSPLRYPGGKSKLEPLMEYLIDKTGHRGGIYIEPFAGGAGIAMGLLEREVVREIVINDYDKGIYSFWRAMLTETDRFVHDIKNVPLTIAEWNLRKDVVHTEKKYSYELGFSTFYLNRTNRSGIVKGGVIGGIDQSGVWKMDVRFNRDDLADRVLRIAKHKRNIHLYNKDVNSFISNFLPKYEDDAFIYFDPPYLEKGRELYMNYFKYEDHVRIEKMINQEVKSDWIITYDDVDEIAEIYRNHQYKRIDLSYSAATKRRASEIMVFKTKSMIPKRSELCKNGVFVNIR